MDAESNTGIRSAQEQQSDPTPTRNKGYEYTAKKTIAEGYSREDFFGY